MKEVIGLWLFEDSEIAPFETFGSCLVLSFLLWVGGSLLFCAQFFLEKA